MTRDEIHLADLARLLAVRGTGQHALLWRDVQGGGKYSVRLVSSAPLGERDARKASFPVTYAPDGWLWGPVDELIAGCE